MIHRVLPGRQNKVTGAAAGAGEQPHLNTTTNIITYTGTCMRFTIYQSCYRFVCIYHIIIAICLRCFHIPNIHIQRKVKPLFQRPIRTTANQNLYATPQKCFILAVLSDELACCH